MKYLVFYLILITGNILNACDTETNSFLLAHKDVFAGYDSKAAAIKALSDEALADRVHKIISAWRPFFEHQDWLKKTYNTSALCIPEGLGLVQEVQELYTMLEAGVPYLSQKSSTRRKSIIHRRFRCIRNIKNILETAVSVKEVPPFYVHPRPFFFNTPLEPKDKNLRLGREDTQVLSLSPIEPEFIEIELWSRLPDSDDDLD